jgi:DNA polymerase-3 subunit gamma/tau
VRIPPQVGKYSVYIIDEVHMLSSTAFNAFLKTLEEPPAHAIFILATTEKHKIIPTILSRCQIYDFQRIKIDDTVKQLKYVAESESINADDEALHIIAIKSDGAMRDALSIFDQLVSLCGTTITYKDVIENLNVLDYEYYFKIIDGAIVGNISTVLLLFDEILENGFDGHNFISGLNSHIRNLLVCKDEVTVKLLETAPAIRKQYLTQTAACPVGFLLNALEIGNTCDLSYKSSKNARLHVELSLIKICRLATESSADSEKKKPDVEVVRKEIVAPSAQKNTVNVTLSDKTEKTVKTFSIKNLINDEVETPPATIKSDLTEEKAPEIEKPELNETALKTAWDEFTGQLSGEGARIISMFKTVKPEIADNQTIKLYFNNADQKETFTNNYKPRLIAFLERKFILHNTDIESIVKEDDSVNIIYSDEQKYNYLSGKFPMLKEIKKTFNLDIN